MRSKLHDKIHDNIIDLEGWDESPAIGRAPTPFENSCRRDSNLGRNPVATLLIRKV